MADTKSGFTDQEQGVRVELDEINPFGAAALLHRMKAVARDFERDNPVPPPGQSR